MKSIARCGVAGRSTSRAARCQSGARSRFAAAAFPPDLQNRNRGIARSRHTTQCRWLSKWRVKSIRSRLLFHACRTGMSALLIRTHVMWMWLMMRSSDLTGGGLTYVISTRSMCLAVRGPYAFCSKQLSWRMIECEVQFRHDPYPSGNTIDATCYNTVVLTRGERGSQAHPWVPKPTLA